MKKILEMRNDLNEAVLIKKRVKDNCNSFKGKIWRINKSLSY